MSGWMVGCLVGWILDEWLDGLMFECLDEWLDV